MAVQSGVWTETVASSRTAATVVRISPSIRTRTAAVNLRISSIAGSVTDSHSVRLSRVEQSERIPIAVGTDEDDDAARPTA